jgi:NADH-quinone oxidoreductase subunit C
MTTHHLLSEHLKSKYNKDIKILTEDGNYIIGSFIIDDVSKVLLKIQQDSLLSIEMLISICCVDYPNNDKRFELVYNFLSIQNNFRFILKLQVNESTLVSSITDIFPNASWYEREVWDMYGIIFSGNNDMRRILTPYGFVGYPMRKDFPLTGHVEVNYNTSSGRVVQNIVNLEQDFRSFEFQSQWNSQGAFILPGDEKANLDNK